MAQSTTAAPTPTIDVRDGSNRALGGNRSRGARRCVGNVGLGHVDGHTRSTVRVPNSPVGRHMSTATITM